MLHSLCGLLLAASLSLIAAGLWGTRALPERHSVAAAALPEPEQTAVAKAPFVVTASGIDYTIRPLYRYTLRGMVVSRHDTSSWWNPTHRSWWKDHVNVLDLCVVWGGNLASGVYRDMLYASGTFTCHVETASRETWARFDTGAIANNHLLAIDPAIVRRLRGMRRGDQIELGGFLAEYAHDTGFPFRRGTSIRRDDQGDGACETIWVTEARILRAAHRGWHLALKAACAGLVLAFVLWILLPPKLDR